ncbi:hypothetical protein DDE82_004926 [Stemphylium lycopersici]|nr:hypothetical protein TW65_03655 [Stemphylium lycopersici]RAR03839.1 hypothetical protein DDE82_004926 [Stemphylium lycopersici]
MWKRLQGHVREKEKHAEIGNPVLLETTYDEDQLKRNPVVTDVQARQQNYVLPPLQSHSLAPYNPPNYRASEVPTASSVYSQPSHVTYDDCDTPTAPSPLAYHDVSPPSSPETEQFFTQFDGPRRFPSMRDVSPMDENRNRLDDELGTSISVLRRAPSVLRSGDAQSIPKQKFWEGKLAPNSKVKWDEYSGEPNSAGKAASVDPGSYAKGAPSSSNRTMGYQVSVTASGPGKKGISFGERLGRFGSKRSPPAQAAAAVEPWSRTTGRAEIAPPLKYQPAEKPLQIPRKTISPSLDHQRSNALAAAVDQASKLHDTQPVTAETRSLDMHEDSIKPVVPLKVGKTSPPGTGLASPTSPKYQGLGITSSINPDPITPTKREQQNESPVTVVNTLTEQPLHPAYRTATPPYTTTDSKNAGSDGNKQANTSHFSWTTYNSATTYQHSPPPSPPPPLPTSAPAPAPAPSGRAGPEPVTEEPSILSRRRPVIHVDRPPPPKPKTYLSPAMAKLASPSAPSPFSTGPCNTSKALPQPPTILSALDNISLLESQQEDLRIQRNNIYRLLTDLNNAAPPNPFLTDFKKARVADQRKKAFEEELDEIRRLEHDVGLRLHRAWKKRERDDPHSAGSALWVRRVTS